MTKVVYIASLSHSGSTLCDMLLSTHSQICGLGEVGIFLDNHKRNKILREAGRHICSCGSPINQCSFWVEFLGYLRLNPEASHFSNYRYLLELAADRGNSIVADSSKYPLHLKRLINAVSNNSGASGELQEKDIFVVHLVRDARGFVSSMCRRADSNQRKTDFMFDKFNQWFEMNNEIEQLVQNSKMQSITITYEDLCFNTDLIVSNLLLKIGLPLEVNVANLNYCKCHIGLGNPMRTDPVLSKRLGYDARWFHDREVQSLYSAMQHIKDYNERIAHQSLVSSPKSKRFTLNSRIENESG